MNLKNLEERKNRKGILTYWEGEKIIYKQCTSCKEIKEIEEFNIDKREKDGRCVSCKECKKQYRKKNVESIRQYGKRWREINGEHKNQYNKQWNKENEIHLKEYQKKRYKNAKEENMKKISNLLKNTNAIMENCKLPIYGSVYKIENIKTGRIYIGQTTLPLKERYSGNIIKTWIKERKQRTNQKFSNELIEEDFIVDEVIAIGICQYHLDKLEAYYIDKYNSYNNGYNNREGNHNTDDGLNEFKEILKKYNLEYINGELTNGKWNI